MAKKLSVILILLISLLGCNSHDKGKSSTGDNSKSSGNTAYDYNEDFLKKEKSLEPEINKTESSVSVFMRTEKYDSIAIAGERMEVLIDKIINDIKATPAPDVKEGENFKEAGVRYFDFMKKMYTVYKDYGHAKDAAGRQVQLDKLQELTSKKTEEIQHIQDVQKKFASENGFMIR